MILGIGALSSPAASASDEVLAVGMGDDYTLGVMDTEGGLETHQVVDGTQQLGVFEPDIAADGRRVVFSYSGGIYLTDIAGRDAKKIYTAPSKMPTTNWHDVVWAPEFNTMIAGLQRNSTTARDIHELRPGPGASGTWAPSPLIQWPKSQRFPAISPDGTKIAFISEAGPEGTGSGGVFLANRDGSNPERLTSGFGPGDTEGINGARNLEFSPDGSKVAVSGTDPESTIGRQIFSVDIATKAVVPLTPERLYGAGPFGWTRDNYLVYLTDDSTEEFDHYAIIKARPDQSEEETVHEFDYEASDMLFEISTLGAASVEMTAEEAEGALESYAPTMHYDDGETYRVQDISSIMNVIGETPEDSNRLQRSNGTPIAFAAEWSEPFPFLSPYYLRPSGHTYGDEGLAAVLETDQLSERNSHSEDAATMQNEGFYSGWVQSRAVHEPTPSPEGTTLEPNDPHWWLQYWFFYYYNDPPLPTSVGDHEGDWEMIQVALGKYGQPVLATYAQHQDSWADSCPWEEMEFDFSGMGGASPRVYVADGSHASYFHSGSGLGGSLDNADGDGLIEETRPWNVQTFEEEENNWLLWPGTWGDSGSSPRGPGMQGDKWDEPAAFFHQSEGCPSGSSELRSTGPPALKIPLRAKRTGPWISLRYGPPEVGSALKGLDATVVPADLEITPTAKTFPVRPGGGSKRIAVPDGGGPYKVVVRGLYGNGSSTAERVVFVD